MATGDNSLAYGLWIVASALNNYMFQIVIITHGIQLYPVTVVDVVHGKQFSANDEDAYETVLESVLSSEEIKKAVSGLLSQSLSNE